MASQSTNPAILFDLDGTLVDSAYEHAIAWSTALRTAGVLVPKWKIHRRIGMSGRSLVRQLTREHSPRHGSVDIKKLESIHDGAFNKFVRTIQPLPGSRELLQRLTHLQVRWAIATTGNQVQTRKLLKTMHIPAKAVVVTGDEVAKAKPSPDVFVEAARRLDTPIEHCVVVGDSIWDMLAAGRRRALGVGMLSGGYSQEELERSGAFRVYADPAEMLAHIEDLGID